MRKKKTPYPKTERSILTALNRANEVMKVLAESSNLFRLEIIGDCAHIYVGVEKLNWDLIEPLALMCIKKCITWQIQRNKVPEKAAYGFIIVISPNRK